VVALKAGEHIGLQPVRLSPCAKVILLFDKARCSGPRKCPS
jgi:hypothetical protein